MNSAQPIAAGGAPLALPQATASNRVMLPAPRTSGGATLTLALTLRRSTRSYSDRTLSVQLLPELLWAAFGINRPGGERVAPYWRHVMVIDVYLAMASGVWRYDAAGQALLGIARLTSAN
jgi:hypothetical protein